MPRFRKASDGVIFATFYWFFFLGAVGTLTYYAQARIKTVLAREFILLSTSIYASNTREMVMPDLIFCTQHLAFDPLKTPLYWDYDYIPLKGPTVPANKSVLTPCVGEYVTEMYIFRSMYSTFPTANTSIGFVGPMFEFNGSSPLASRAYGVVYIVPPENNRYRNTTYVTGRSPLADRTFGEYQHAFVQDNSVAWLTSTLETTRVLRSDFLGLFGLYNDSATIYDVKSNAEVILDQNKTHIYYQFPNMQIESRQVLLLSIPEAISSWGGAFSIILSIFYALFGKGAFSPFGIIQKSVLRNGTRAKIASVYTNGRKGNNENNNDKSNSLTYLDNNKQDARDTNAPLPFVLGGANYQPCQQDLTALHQQQQEIHHEELVALRQQIRALRQDVSHLQRHEQRVKEFYLDMELMETADVAPGATMPEFGQPTSERPFTSGKSDSLSGGEGHNVRQRKGWAQKLFNNEAEFQEVPREETLALRRAEHGMGGYTQHTQQTDPTPENVHWSAGSGRDANIEMRPI